MSSSQSTPSPFASLMVLVSSEKKSLSRALAALSVLMELIPHYLLWLAVNFVQNGTLEELPQLAGWLALALSRLGAGKTVLMIDHRLRTVEYAEQILVLDNGTIAEHGTHQHLLVQQGIYQRLWPAQECGEVPQ